MHLWTIVTLRRTRGQRGSVPAYIRMWPVIKKIKSKKIGLKRKQNAGKICAKVVNAEVVPRMQEEHARRPGLRKHIFLGC